MNVLFLRKQYTIFIFLISLPFFAGSEGRRNAEFSPEEINIIHEDENNQYIYLDKNKSKLQEVVLSISALDCNKKSPIHMLQAHINNGFSIGEINAIVAALEYGKSVLNKEKKRLKKSDLKELRSDIEEILSQIIMGVLNIASKDIHKHASCSEILNKLNVLGKALFNKSVRIGKNLEVDKNLT